MMILKNPARARSSSTTATFFSAICDVSFIFWVTACVSVDSFQAAWICCTRISASSVKALKSELTMSRRNSAGLVLPGTGYPMSRKYSSMFETGPKKHVRPPESRSSLSNSWNVVVEGWWILAMMMIYIVSTKSNVLKANSHCFPSPAPSHTK